MDFPFTLLDTGSFLHAERVCSSEKALASRSVEYSRRIVTQRPHPGNQVVWFNVHSDT